MAATALAAIPVLVLLNGATLTLGDVAVIEERFEPPQDRALVDGTPAIVLDVSKALGADALRVLDGVAALVAQETARLPAARAAGEAVRSRFRPIFVSVSTAIMGLVPLLLETSTQVQTLKPRQSPWSCADIRCQCRRGYCEAVTPPSM